MKHIERLAREYAIEVMGTDIPDVIAGSVRDYTAGFCMARLMASNLLLGLPDHKTQMLSFVVKAIAEARVEDAEEESKV